MPAKTNQASSKLETTSCVHAASTGTPYNSKRLILCCDGTWNDTNSRLDPASNVSRLANAFAHKCCSGMSQIIYYHSGVGTEEFPVAKIIGAMLGKGVIQDIVECYRFICDNYAVGDEIVIIGFSRGAFTARSVADMVCALGFLNHAGLEQLPHIFTDYKQWPKWNGKSKFDEKKQFLGFTLQNMDRVEKIKNTEERVHMKEQLMKKEKMESGEAWREASKEVVMPAYMDDSDKMQEELSRKKRGTFDAIVKANREEDDPSKKIVKTGAEYRKLLVEYGMCRVDRSDNEVKEVEGCIKAIGVWDTVGSLGIPKSPFSIKLTRHAEEARLASLQIHPNVEYALHAIALDEWRTAFRPTMWELSSNKKTKLRQVWFPGNHGNVGGGWEDQQIATIALAWMADRLSSIGVEFSKEKMKHIFYSLQPDQLWGMGLIRSPIGITAFPDRFYGLLMWPIRWLAGKDRSILRRTPGKYQGEGPDGPRDLKNTNEFVHPSVRIRYLYGGRDLDNKGIWDMRGYELLEENVSPDSSHASEVEWPHCLNRGESTLYHTLAGPVTYSYGTLPPKIPSHKIPLPENPRQSIVHSEQPHHLQLESLPTVRHRWSWRDSDTNKTLPEEHIGNWERMYIKITNEPLLWQKGKNSVDIPRLHKKRILKVLDKYRVYGLHYGLHDVVSWDKSGNRSGNKSGKKEEEA